MLAMSEKNLPKKPFIHFILAGGLIGLLARLYIGYSDQLMQLKWLPVVLIVLFVLAAQINYGKIWRKITGYICMSSDKN
jgi:hypothetical protein